jgi:15-cis-phytoene synthase
VPRDVAPALLAGWQTEGLLRQALAGHAAPQLPEVTKRWQLLWQTVSGRW